MGELIFKGENLYKKYRNTYVINDLSINVPNSAIYGFVGENGAGKTTTLRLIAGLAYPTSGKMELFGEKDLIKINLLRKYLGCIIESPSIYPNMTAFQNLEVQRIQRNISDKSCIERSLYLVNLNDEKRKKAKDFSLGMKQRLGLAIALLGNPRFLVLDEPTNGLDPTGIIEMRKLILQINQEERITFVISSHILSELHQLATHYGFIHNGRMLEETSAQELSKKFRKFIHIQVSDATEAAKVINNRQLCPNFEINSKNDLYIYDYSGNVEQLTNAFFEAKLGVRSISQQGEDLENYYMSLIGERKNVKSD